MKVSFVVPDLGSNILGATRKLAAYLSGAHDVEIVGTCLWGRPNAMYSDGFPYKAVQAPRAYRFPEFFPAVRDLAAAATGDVLVAMKAQAPSLPAALLAKKRRGAKVVAYLDEWDGATPAQWPLPQRLARLLHHAHHPTDDLYAPHWERRLRECDAIVGTTTFLQKRFGATRIHLGADCDFFTPRPPADVDVLKASLGLAGKRLLVFGGVLRRHKGVEPYLDAVASLRDRHDLHFLVAGPRNDAVQDILAQPAYRDFVHCTGAIPWADMPLYLSLADILVVPLSDSLMAQSQMPCKVFEAMAMAKPVVATSISDLPEILDDCGWLAPPGAPGPIADAIADILDHPDAAADRARRAREKCLAEYSSDRSRDQFRAFIDAIAARP